MSDSSGAKVWEIEARPFGDGATVSGTASLNLRFPGQYYDAENGLNYNYFRDYNPTLGRYIQANPIGVERGENHLYGFVKNNPVNFVDPFGLELADWCSNIQNSTARAICEGALTPLVCLSSDTACCELQYKGCMGKIDMQGENCEIEENNCTAQRMKCMTKAGMPDRDSSTRDPLSPYPEGRVPPNRDQVPKRYKK